MSRNLRSKHKPADSLSLSDELDDLLAAPSLKPNLRFLGLQEDGSNTDASDLTAGDAETASQVVIASPAVIMDIATEQPPARQLHRGFPALSLELVKPLDSVKQDLTDIRPGLRESDGYRTYIAPRDLTPGPIGTASPAVTAGDTVTAGDADAASPAVINSIHSLPAITFKIGDYSEEVIPAGHAVTASPAIIIAPDSTTQNRPAQDLSAGDALTTVPADLLSVPRQAESGPAASTTARQTLVSTSDHSPKKKRLIHRCSKVQDGHSHIEQAVYQILWNSGIQNDDGTRLSRLGLPRIARDACVHERNIGIIIRRLVQKQSVEIIQKEISDLRTPRVYRVFAYREILDRRKTLGLEWVVRGRGVEFVDPTTGEPVFRDADLSLRNMFPRSTAGDAVTSSASTALTPLGSPDVIAPATPAVTPGPLEKDPLGKKQETSSSTDHVILALKHYGVPDDDVVAKLVQACHRNAATCTTDEIVDFIHQKGLAILRDRSGDIKRPIGFLLATVPKCFVGESYRVYRETRAKQQQEERERQERAAEELQRWEDEQRAILADPKASEEDKRFAKQMLHID